MSSICPAPKLQNFIVIGQWHPSLFFTSSHYRFYQERPGTCILSRRRISYFGQEPFAVEVGSLSKVYIALLHRILTERRPQTSVKSWPYLRKTVQLFILNNRLPRPASTPHSGHAIPAHLVAAISRANLRFLPVLGSNVQGGIPTMSICNSRVLVEYSPI